MIFDVILVWSIWAVYKPFVFGSIISTKKLSAEGKLWLKLLAGISSRTCNSIPPQFLLKSNPKEVWNLSFINWLCGKLLSSFHSDIMKTSINPLICSQKNLVLNELMFKFPKTNLLILLIRISLRVPLAFEVFVLEAFSVS